MLCSDRFIGEVDVRLYAALVVLRLKQRRGEPIARLGRSVGSDPSRLNPTDAFWPDCFGFPPNEIAASLFEKLDGHMRLVYKAEHTRRCYLVRLQNSMSNSPGYVSLRECAVQVVDPDLGTIHFLSNPFGVADGVFPFPKPQPKRCPSAGLQQPIAGGTGMRNDFKRELLHAGHLVSCHADCEWV